MAGIIKLKDLLSGLCYRLARSAWLRLQANQRPGPYLAALGCTPRGMLAKSVVVTVPTTLLILQVVEAGALYG